MSDNLKKAFNEKMHVAPSKHFDLEFKRRLELSQSNKSWLTRWYAFGAVGAVTLTLFLFVMKSSFNYPFKNSAYMYSIIQMEQDEDESITDSFNGDMIDLTTFPSDEI